MMRGAGVSGRMEPHIPQPVLFAPVASLVERMLQAKRDLSLSRELRKLDRISCLILDDIGYVQHDRAEMEEIVDARHVAISATEARR